MRRPGLGIVGHHFDLVDVIFDLGRQMFVQGSNRGGVLGDHGIFGVGRSRESHDLIAVPADRGNPVGWLVPVLGPFVAPAEGPLLARSDR